MRITGAEIHNILSIGKIKFQFSDTGLVLVDGRNEDDDTANGAGKSAFFNAISFGIYGKVPRKITSTEILRRGTKRGFSRITIDKNNDEWVVERHRPNKVSYFKNGVEQTITQEAFEASIGMTYTQFLISMYAAQSEGCKLISLNDSAKKDFFLQLMNLEKFATSKKEVDSEIKKIKAQILHHETEMDKAASNIDIWREQLVDHEAWKIKHSSYDYSDLELQRNELQKITRPNLSRYYELESKISDKIQKLNRYEQQERTLELEKALVIKQLDSLNNTVAHDLECPSCNEKLCVSGQGVATIDRVRSDRLKQKETLNKKAEDLDIQLLEFSSLQEDKNKVLEMQRQLKLKVRQETENYDKASKQVMDLERTINQRKMQQERLVDIANQAERASAKIAVLKDTIADCSQMLNKDKGELELLETVAALLSPTGAPAYIMDSVVDVFNDKMAEYVNLIWPNATYRIQTFKETKAGEVRAKFSEQLIIGGQRTSVGSLSGGEFRCMSLAMDFAVVDVLETMFSIKVNPVVLDEPFEGLDISNRERVIELLEQVATQRQVIVIDHASEAKAMFSDVIKIVKRNGVSMLA